MRAQVREAGFAHRLFDLLDERGFHHRQVATFACQLLGFPGAGRVPNWEHERAEFVQYLRDAAARTPGVDWDPRTGHAGSALVNVAAVAKRLSGSDGGGGSALCPCFGGGGGGGA